MPKNVAAVDLGAESGRVMLVSFDGSRLQYKETHRFPNIPVQAHRMLHWDVLRIWHEIQTGLDAVLSEAASIGVDTWGVDFALLDRNGTLISNPVHYRDSNRDGAMEWVFERVPRRLLFERTGIQFMILNGLYQLAAYKRANSPLLDAAHTFLTIADLFNFWLCGALTCEFTHATTQQTYNPRAQRWDTETLEALDIPSHIFPEIVQPGTKIGSYQGIPVIAPSCHDTGSAVVAVPATTKNYAYLSSGTWSLLGAEVDHPIINDTTYAANFTNEGGVEGTFRLLKNVAGMWLVQQSRLTWAKEGKDYSYEEMAALAAAEKPFFAFIDPDDPLFLPPGDMPARIREFCQQTHQPVPENAGQILRVIYESLALKYRHVLDKLIQITGNDIEQLHIIGGGSQNALLSQMTADCIGHEVITGPVEATTLGNAIVQFIALGEIGNVAQARQILSHSFRNLRYHPKETDQWDEAYSRFQSLLTTL